MTARMRRALHALALLIALSGCVPSIRPAPPAASVAPPLSWRDAPVGVGEIDPRWWRAFGDPVLDGLVEQALARNTDVLTAVAAVDEARAAARLARSAQLPTLGAAGSFVRSKGVGLPTATALTGTLDATWAVDLFGRLHALTQAARRQYVASQAERDAVALSVATSTAQAYLMLLSLDAQLRVTRDTLRSRADTLRLTQDQRNDGYVSDFEVTQAQSEYEAIAQQIPALTQSIRAQENALSVLTGALPTAIARDRTLRDLTLPVVPATMPSALLRRRPDIAAAEYRLAAADSTIAARRAEFLPQLNLSGDVGATGVSLANYNPVSIWTVGASLLAPLFEGGALRANFESATATRDQAAFSYRGSVLAAFRDVETSLSATDNLAEQNARVLAQLAVLKRSLALARERYGEGYSSFLDQLDAQRSLYGAELAAITTREAQLSNAVALAAALGGGWMPDRLTRTRAGASRVPGRGDTAGQPTGSGTSRASPPQAMSAAGSSASGASRTPALRERDAPRARIN